jgi:predicted transcriptional regulator
MTREEANAIRAQLDTLGLSQRAAADALAITERTMRRYCSGDADVPRVIFLALHLIELAQKDEKQRNWLAESGVRLAYVRADGTDADVTKQESGRLGERASTYRKHAKKLVKSKR